MCGRALVTAATLGFAHLAHAQAGAPDWASQVVGVYVGRDHNVGEMQCERVEFSLQDGALVGHYRIEDDPPFEGELTYLGPDSDDDGGVGGRFLWSDRDGDGIRVIHFAPGFATFRSLWGGTVPDPRLTGYGGRDIAVPGCGGPTS